MTTTVRSQKFVRATLEQVYLSFTRSLLLRQWLCDFATVTPRPGGRMYLWWNGDFYSAGEYLALEENKLVQFSWRSRSEPDASTVLVILEAVNDGTQVTLEHSVPDGKEWEKRAAGFKAEWDATLLNLASVLETGLDKRIYDRPMLGIQISDFSAEIAKASGIPVSEGVRLAEAAEGMGAHAAGLRQDDVIVSLDGKTISNDFGTLALALQGKKGGDKVDVVFYRGAEKHAVLMELTRRPLPNIPWEPSELARQVRAKYDQAFTELEAAFSGVSENEAGQCPAPGEWNAKQTLAHLIHTERNWLANIDDLLGGYERNADDFGGNISAHIDATVTAFNGASGMINEMKRLADEVVAYLENLPADFVQRKGDYLHVGSVMLNGMLPHTQSHIEQIRAAIAAAKK